MDPNNVRNLADTPTYVSLMQSSLTDRPIPYGIGLPTQNMGDALFASM